MVLRKDKNHSLKVKDVIIKNPFVLAPMAAINCTAFRLLCKYHGVGLIYTQMIDADKLIEKKPSEVKDFLNILDKERPVSVQLIGSDIKNLKKAIKLVEPYSDIIDYNVGCILDDYVKKGCGGYLLKDVDRLKQILKEIVDCTKKPVSCKIRIGWDSQNINGVAVAQMAEDAGVSLVAVHGRTVEQKYGKKVNWTIMKQIKEKLNIPVIANGDVNSYDAGLNLLDKTGCDFVMVGREAKYSPWVFNKDFVINNENVKKEILRFIDFYEKYEKRKSMLELTQHVYWMFRNIKTRLRPQWMYECKDVAELKSFLDRI
jgi:tRNA-dihydrouridine synthase B